MIVAALAGDRRETGGRQPELIPIGPLSPVRLFLEMCSSCSSLRAASSSGMGPVHVAQRPEKQRYIVFLSAYLFVQHLKNRRYSGCDNLRGSGCEKHICGEMRSPGLLASRKLAVEIVSGQKKLCHAALVGDFDPAPRRKLGICIPIVILTPIGPISRPIKGSKCGAFHRIHHKGLRGSEQSWNTFV